jgi:hypothetical protein
MRDIQLIDVEASGLHFDSYPIEVAILSIEQPQSWLIAPQPTWTYWDPNAEALHGISRDLLRSEGMSCALVAAQLSAAIRSEDRVLYSDAAEWDWDWIRTLYLSVDAVLDFNVLSIQQLMTSRQVEVFNSEKRRLAEVKTYRLHRAASDVALLAHAYRSALFG